MRLTPAYWRDRAQICIPSASPWGFWQLPRSRLRRRSPWPSPWAPSCPAPPQPPVCSHSCCRTPRSAPPHRTPCTRNSTPEPHANTRRGVLSSVEKYGTWYESSHPSSPILTCHALCSEHQVVNPSMESSDISCNHPAQENHICLHHGGQMNPKGSTEGDWPEQQWVQEARLTRRCFPGAQPRCTRPVRAWTCFWCGPLPSGRHPASARPHPPCGRTRPHLQDGCTVLIIKYVPGNEAKLHICMTTAWHWLSSMWVLGSMTGWDWTGMQLWEKSGWHRWATSSPKAHLFAGASRRTTHPKDRLLQQHDQT